MPFWGLPNKSAMSLVLNPGTADTRPSKARKVKNQRPVFPVVSLIAGGITGGLEAGIAVTLPWRILCIGN